MVTPHISVISVYCHSSQKFYAADGFSNTIKIFPFHSEKKKPPKKKTSNASIPMRLLTRAKWYLIHL